MNTEEDWKRESFFDRKCGLCAGLGYLPATYSRGAIPCGCDEPMEDGGEQVGTPEGVNQNTGKPSSASEGVGE